MSNDSSRSDVDSGETMIDIKNEEVLGFLNEILDKPVILAWPLGVKGTERKWEGIMQQEKIRQAIARGGNLGIVLGEKSGKLVTIDIDDNEEVEAFFKFAPWAKDTLISVGRNGCQCWFVIEGNYPHKRAAWKMVAGKPTIEFRADGVQSIIWGDHPDKNGKIDGRYTNNGKKPKHISYLELDEYRTFLRERDGECDEEWREGQKGDFTWTKAYKGCDLKELDLIGLLKEAGIRPTEKIQEEGIEKYAIVCPWIDDHTTGEGKRDAAVHMFTPRGKYWPAFKCFHAHCDGKGLKDLLDWLTRERNIRPSTVRKYCGGERQRIEIVDQTDLIEAPTLPKPIIDGLLYPELKMLIASASKIGKTWLGIDMGLSLAGGLTWMGFDTCQSNVLYLNLEMPRLWFDTRICDVKKARGIATLPRGSFKVANLRGSNALEGNLDGLYEVCERQGPFNVIIYDPIYKLLGDLDENKATDVAKLLGMIDAIGKTTGVASVIVHHYAKGDAWQKNVRDRASGSGVFLRDPDSYMAITEMGDENSGVARVDYRLRCSRPVTSFGIRWDNYQWKRDPSIDISKKKRKKADEAEEAPKSNEPRISGTGRKMLEILKDNPAGLIYARWKEIAIEVKKVAKVDNFNYTMRRLKEEGWLKQVDELYYIAEDRFSLV